MKYTKDDVRLMLKGVKEKYYKPLPHREPYDDLYWKNEAMWLGDTSYLTMIPYKASQNGKTMYVKSDSFFLSPLMSFNKDYKEDTSDNIYQTINDIHNYDFGGGHFLQRIQRAMGFEPDLKPTTHFDIECNKFKNSVLINIEGHHYNHLTEQVAPIIQKYVDRNKNRFYFAETWANRPLPYIDGIRHFQFNIINLIKEMSKFEYLIGFDSGLMHIASGLGIKSVIITDSHMGLKTDMLYLPREFSNPLLPGAYLYPQNVHLYMNDENELVKQFTLDNLERAIDGELYPYWSDDFLDIIF